ncbi:hypothetical protein SANTM175S_10391 [Streptomyces antimycoticus]
MLRGAERGEAATSGPRSGAPVRCASRSATGGRKPWQSGRRPSKPEPAGERADPLRRPHPFVRPVRPRRARRAIVYAGPGDQRVGGPPRRARGRARPARPRSRAVVSRSGRRAAPGRPAAAGRIPARPGRAGRPGPRGGGLRGPEPGVASTSAAGTPAARSRPAAYCTHGRAPAPGRFVGAEEGPQREQRTRLLARDQHHRHPVPVDDEHRAQGVADSPGRSAGCPAPPARYPRAWIPLATATAGRLLQRREAARQRMPTAAAAADLAFASRQPPTPRRHVCPWPATTSPAVMARLNAAAELGYVLDERGRLADTAAERQCRRRAPALPPTTVRGPSAPRARVASPVADSVCRQRRRTRRPSGARPLLPPRPARVHRIPASRHPTARAAG